MDTAVSAKMTCPWRNALLCYEELDSTNAHAKRLAAQGAPDGTVLIARRQTAGRGRLGRSFQSPEGLGVYMSVILRPNCRPEALMHLTCAVGVAMCNAVETVSGIRPEIKWINDLVLDGKKLAGILTELSCEPQTGKVAYAIVGVGINCCQTREDFLPELRDKATSLSMVTGKPISPDDMAAAMADALWHMAQTLLIGRAAVMDQYRKDCVTVGKEISVLRGDTARRGTALAIDEDGALLVRYADGSREAVTCGEVSVRGLYGYV